MRPDRIVVGSEDDQATRVMRELYAPFERNHSKLLMMDLASAELTKYAANAMLATRISFMNEMALLAEALGADIDSVRRGIGSDPRIGSHFLYAGCGYGGSCFPKDVAALSRAAKLVGTRLGVLGAVEAANEHQKHLLSARIETRFGSDLSGKVFALWGLAFKPGTDDMREAPSQVLIRELASCGASIQAYDPVATNEARRVLGDVDSLSFQAHAMDVLKGADALVIVTEWKAFRTPDISMPSDRSEIQWLIMNKCLVDRIADILAARVINCRTKAPSALSKFSCQRTLSLAVSHQPGPDPRATNY